MPTRQEYEKSSLAGGEISPELHAATDLRAHQVGLEIQENFVTVLEGVVTRRPGTRFVMSAVDGTERGKLWPFRFTSGDYYMLALNGGKMRVLRDGGFVPFPPLDPEDGAPYEIDIPWTEQQLATLRAAALDNTLTFTVQGTGSAGRIQKITRIAADQWTIAEYLPLNGPIELQNLDVTKTIAPSAISGAITLVGTNNPFDTGMTGGVMRIDEANAALTQLWIAGETITAPLGPTAAPTSTFGNLTSLANLFDGNVATTASLAAVSECYAGYHWATPQAVAAITIATNPAGLGGFTNAVTGLIMEIWASNGAAPVSATAGTLLGSYYFVDGPGASASASAANATLAWNNVWMRLRTWSGASVTFTIASESVFALASTLQSTLRRFGENIYQALSGGLSGTQPPVHDQGDAAYGGIAWRFRSKIYGFVRISAVSDANNAQGNVILQLPDSALLASTYRWWPPSWSDSAGWPEIVVQNGQKFLFFRRNRLWITRPATTADFLFTDDTDSAIAIALRSDEGLPEIRWATAGGIVVLGAADMEWMLRAPASDDVLQAQTIDPENESQEGSIAQIPARVDRGVIFIGANGKRLHYVEADKYTQRLDPEEISAAARHILGAGAAQIVWQRDPHKLGWIRLDDGGLAAVTFMPKQKIVALHRHPLTNGFVEDIAAIPALDGGRSEVYLWIRRTINGVTRRYIELLQPFFQPIDASAPTAEGAWLVDCGLRYHGPPPPELTITGLEYLENEIVAVFVDGAMQSRKRVVGGSIELDAGSVDLAGGDIDVLVGLPIVARLKDLPRSLAIGGGSTRGKPQRANTVIVDVLNSGGGQVRMTHPKAERYDDADDTPFDDLIETGGDMYGAPIKLFTGQIPLSVSDDGAASAVVEIVCDDAMPCTVRAIVPDLIVEGD